MAKLNHSGAGAMPQKDAPIINIAIIGGKTYCKELLEKTTDVNSDGKVDQKDVSIIVNIFSVEIGESGYDRKMDLDDDGTIDMRDVAKVAKDSGET